MAIRHGLLALLDEGPAYGYQLKAAFEDRTGGTWPLNIGQVYTTLARAERDGLVAQLDADTEGRVVYEITDAGRREVARWFGEPVRREVAPRDELTIKLAVAVTAPGVDIAAIVQTQRAETMRTLQALTRLKIDADPAADTAWHLVLERLIFDAEAESRWLDHVESRLQRASAARRVAGAPDGERAGGIARPVPDTHPGRGPASGRTPRAEQGNAR
jgi:DNA-binding PadR family transcriptional regulator